MAGWIKLHKKLLENPIFKKAEPLQLFMYCLLRANHDETKIIWNGKEEILEKGSFITGRKVLALATGQTESAVWKRLDSLRKMGMTTQKSNNKFTIVKVLNYCTYQGNENKKEQQSNNKVTTKEQQSNTDKNLRTKELKNKEKDLKYTYAELVRLTSAEYNRLVDEHGEVFVKRCIEVLDCYKGANNKKYADDNRAIKNWVVKRVQEEQAKANPKSKIPRAFQSLIDYEGVDE